MIINVEYNKIYYRQAKSNDDNVVEKMPIINYTE